MPSVLFDILKGQGSLVAYEFVRESVGIKSGECIRDIKEWLMNNASRVIAPLKTTIEDLNRYVNKTTGKENLSGLKFFSKVEYDPFITAPVSRAAGYDDSNDISSVLPILLLSGIGGKGGDNDMLMYILLLSGDMGGQGSGSMLDNPLLLFALLGNGDGDSSGLGDFDDTMQLILLMSLVDPNNGMGSVMPLILLSSMSGDGNGIEDIMPLLFLLSTFEGEGTSSINDILPLLLLSTDTKSNEDDGFLKTFLIMSLLSSGDTCGQNDLLPLLLLMSSSKENDKNDKGSNLIFIIMMMGFLDGGSSSSIESILPFLLLEGGSLGDGSNIGTLAILLSVSSLGEGGMSSILPLLLLQGDKSMELSDILLITALGGGGLGGQSGDMINSILPLLLVGGLDDIDSSLLPVLLLSFSGGQIGQQCVKQHHDPHMTGYPEHGNTYPAENNPMPYPHYEQRMSNPKFVDQDCKLSNIVQI